MPRLLKIIAIVLITLAVAIILFLIFSGKEEKAEIDEDETKNCISLGCPQDTKYVGSAKSDKYYKCGCRWAKIIDKENLVCFETDQEALGMGYEKRDC